MALGPQTIFLIKHISYAPFSYVGVCKGCKSSIGIRLGLGLEPRRIEEPHS